MYCPRCATENLDTVSFCRACGADIHLVPQAMTGNLPATQQDSIAVESGGRRRNRKKQNDEDRPASTARGIEKIFSGIGFIMVALAIWRFMPGGQTWWFFMLIPAFALIGGGAAQFVRLGEHHAALHLPVSPQPPPALTTQSTLPLQTPATLSQNASLPPRRTGEMLTPPLSPASVTEGTTRHLGVEETPQKDAAK